jgi:pSer/pThr/pTyr-binding forkhead associated (FHA) protein
VILRSLGHHAHAADETEDFVIGCSKCGKENQDHYKFCLGCGAELPRDAAPKAFTPGTPPQGVKAVAKPSAGVAGGGLDATALPPAKSPIADPAPVISHSAVSAGVGPQAPLGASAANFPQTLGAVPCPQCGHPNTGNNVFCGSCGFRLAGAAAKSAAPPAVAPAATAGSVLLTALRADGSEAGTYNLPGGTVLIGRDTGGIFAGDSYLSPRHATFRQPAVGKLHVKDEASLNGVYKKLTPKVAVELQANDVFRIGQEIIRFEPLTPLAPSPDGVERLGAPSKGYIGRIALITGRDTTGNAFPVPEAGIHLGRERGDVLFPEDGYVSGLHCQLEYQAGKLTLTDFGSSNGTFIRLREEVEVVTGDVLLMGQQLFRITM